jgi:mono/diheme cytochrome c family protein
MDSRRKNKLSLSGIALLAASLAAASWNAGSGDALGADLERGRILHDTHCISCHGTQVYKRGSKVATNYDEIRTQVVRWETNVSLRWNDSDIDAVATYLARTFYMVPCPVC